MVVLTELEQYNRRITELSVDTSNMRQYLEDLYDECTDLESDFFITARKKVRIMRLKEKISNLEKVQKTLWEYTNHLKYMHESLLKLSKDEKAKTNTGGRNKPPTGVFVGI